MKRKLHLICFNSQLQEVLQCKLCNSSFSTALELDAHSSVFHKDSNGCIACPAATSFGDGLLRYQQTEENAVQATTTLTATTPMNSVQQQTLPSVNSMSQQQEQHPEQQQQNIQDSNDSVRARLH